MKILGTTLFTMSIISWLGLLPCLIMIGVSPKSNVNQVMSVFCVMLLMLIISTIALEMFSNM